MTRSSSRHHLDRSARAVRAQSAILRARDHVILGVQLVTHVVIVILTFCPYLLSYSYGVHLQLHRILRRRHQPVGARPLRLGVAGQILTDAFKMKPLGDGAWGIVPACYVP